MCFAKKVWLELASIDVGNRIEKKGNLSYLSWAWAWDELMSKFPESSYEFKAPVSLPDGSVEIWVKVAISDSGQIVVREMWLPVMDYKNKSILNPTSRDISDTRMRCLTKCLAMFGLGHYIYAGEDIPDQAVSFEAKKAEGERNKDEYEKIVAQNKESIFCIKEGLQSDDLSTAAEAWFELDKDVMEALWRAQSKGGCFSTIERDTMKSSEFRISYFGENKDAS